MVTVLLFRPRVPNTCVTAVPAVARLDVMVTLPPIVVLYAVIAASRATSKAPPFNTSAVAFVPKAEALLRRIVPAFKVVVPATRAAFAAVPKTMVPAPCFVRLVPVLCQAPSVSVVFAAVSMTDVAEAPCVRLPNVTAAVVPVAFAP